MNQIAGYPSDDIRNAVKQIKKIKPDYALMLDLYEKIYIAQEESKNSVNINDFSITEEILTVKLKEQFPLVTISQFIIDSAASEKLFNNLCTILLDAGSTLTETVKTITELVENKKLILNDLFSEFLCENEDLFENTEKIFNIDKTVLGFLIYNSIKPSLSLFSEKISHYLDKEKEWSNGYCPVCGSMPEMSTFEENGKRYLICGFCSHKWTAKRIYCPFCENSDHETLQYYEIDGEEEYRVDTCDKCKKYIKTVDIKKTSRTIYLPLENQSTPYIDFKFKEMGYKPGNIDQD